MQYKTYRGYRIGWHNPGLGWFAHIWRPGGSNIAHRVAKFLRSEALTLRAAEQWVDSDIAKAT